jgi:hypothetical protein
MNQDKRSDKKKNFGLKHRKSLLPDQNLEEGV